VAVVALPCSSVQLVDDARVEEPAPFLVAEEMHIEESARVLAGSIDHSHYSLVEVFQGSLLDELAE